MSTIRPCANDACLRYFKPRRPHQRFCSTNCRRESWAAKPKNSPQNPGERVRRATRDGKGAKVYLQPEEIKVLQFARFQSRSAEDWESFRAAQRKLTRAVRRLR